MYVAKHQFASIQCTQQNEYMNYEWSEDVTVINHKSNYYRLIYTMTCMYVIPSHTAVHSTTNTHNEFTLENLTDRLATSLYIPYQRR